MEPLASTSPRARRESPTLPLGGVGRIPPQAIELEEAVLGALLIDRDALTKVVDILAAESFYVEAHQHIFENIAGYLRIARYRQIGLRSGISFADGRSDSPEAHCNASSGEST